MNSENHRVVAAGLLFPEGPVYLGRGTVALVEAARGTVSRVAPDGAVEIIATCGGGPNGLAIGPDSALYVCNNGGCTWSQEPGRLRPTDVSPDYIGGWIDRVDPATGETTTLYDRCGDLLLSGPNDLVFEPDGGFYFTDFGRSHRRHRDHGGIYYARPDGSHVSEVVYPVHAPNGIGLSPDGSVLYVAETETGRLWAFDLDGPGRIRRHPYPSPHGGRLICGFPGYQRLDSLAVDCFGNICVATLVTGAITVVSPAGEILRAIPTGDPITTNLCFGGPDLRTAYVTLGGSGRLIAIDWPEPGLRLAFEPPAVGGSGDLEQART